MAEAHNVSLNHFIIALLTARQYSTGRAKRKTGLILISVIFLHLSLLGVLITGIEC